jgi:hypothetical protein
MTDNSRVGLTDSPRDGPLVPAGPRVAAVMAMVWATSCTGALTIGFVDGGIAGLGEACGGDHQIPCAAGLDCADGGCLIAPHSPLVACVTPADCESTSLGTSIDCEEKICCNSLGKPCGEENDCCTAFLCLDNVCTLETGHAFCMGSADCASGDCGTDTFCSCLADGAPATAYQACCSGHLNAAGNACGGSTLDAGCSPSGPCSPNTEQCQAGTCCITGIGSKTEPCFRKEDCCQSPVALLCNTFNCCNELNGPCMTNDDCCVSNICNAAPGQVGLCKVNSGTTVCRAQADCISGSCDIPSGRCN